MRTSEPVDVPAVSRNDLAERTIEDLLDSLRAYQEELRSHRDRLDDIVRERTAELELLNEKLRCEVEERKRTDEALRSSEEKYRLLLESIPAIAYSVPFDAGDPAFWVSPRIESVLGVERAEIETAPNFLGTRIVPEDRNRVSDERAQAIREGAPYSMEYRVVGKGGVTVCMRDVGTVARDRAGRPKLIQGVLLDVTEQHRISEELKVAERHLVQKEKLALLGLLVSAVAHEINNPSNFISFNIPILRSYVQRMTEILEEREADLARRDFCGMSYVEFRDDMAKLLDNMEHGCTRIHDVVSRLRSFARKREAHEFHDTDLKQVIEKALAICRGEMARKGIQCLEVEIPPEARLVRSCSEDIEVVLVNFLMNAIHASDKRDSRIAVHVRGGDTVSLTVSDNGCGMDERTCARIFEPFFTTKEPGVGTGLGLYICKCFVEALGGRIEVSSLPGRGSSFSVVLPGERPHT